MSTKLRLRYCTTPKDVLLERYKGLIVKIARKTLTEADVKGFPLDYAPKDGKLYLSMVSRHDIHWTLAESWVIHHGENPPDFLVLDMNYAHNSILYKKGFWCFCREVEEPLTLKLLINKVTKGKVLLF